MSSYFKFLYNLPAAFIQAMSPSVFTRLKHRLYAAPSVSKDVRATPEEEAQDREVLENAITKAVSSGLNNDEFLKNFAIHVSSQIQPILKGTLDLSGLESKLLSSNRQLMQRIDEAKLQTAGDLESLSSLLDISNTTNTSRISAIETAVSQIKTSIADLGSDVKAIYEQISSPDTTLLASHTSKLDNIAARLEEFHKDELEPLIATLETHTIELDGITTGVHSIQKQLASPDTSILESYNSKLDTITSDHASIKAAIEAGSDSSKNDLSGVKTNLISILSTIETQTAIIADNKDKDINTKILQKLNDSHTVYADALSEIKSSVDSHSASLSDLKTGDLSPEILLAVRLSNESHKNHESALSAIKADIENYASTLDEIKVATISNPAEAVDFSNLKASLHTISTNIESQNGTLAEIKAVTSIPHPNPEKPDFTSLESSLAAVIAGIESQNVTLAEIKSAADAPVPTAENTQLTGIESSINSIISSIDIQTATLSDINAAVVAETAAHDAATTDLNTIVNSISSNIDHQNATLSMIKTSCLLVPELLSAINAQDTLLGDIKKATFDPKKLDFTLLETSVKELTTAIGSQSDTLSELKTASSGAEILKAVAAQDMVLAEIKEPSLAVLANLTALMSNLTAAKDEVIVKVEEIKPFITAIPERIASVSEKPSNSAILEEIKPIRDPAETNASIVPNDIGVEDKEAAEADEKGVQEGIKEETTANSEAT